MEFYESSASIVAPPDQVWKVLRDAPAYPDWESGVERVEGTIAAGQKIKVFSAVSPGRAFPVEVAIDEGAGVMTWSGGMPLGLFRGVRTFTVRAEDGGRTEFTMREEFSGPLLRMIWRSMPDLGPSFAMFATGLKAQAEHAHGSS